MPILACFDAIGNDVVAQWPPAGIVLGGREQAVDLSSLASLGKIAGLGGIALGVVVLLVRPMIDRVSSVPAAERGRTLRLLALGAFVIGALGIVAWMVAGMGGSVTGGPCSVTTGGSGTASGSTVNCTNVPTPTGKP